MQQAEQFIIYTDGGSRGNPGPAAIGVVLQNGEGRALKEYGEAIGKATNNIAEYTAIVFALKKLRQLIGKERIARATVEIRVDSELAARQLNAQYKIKERDLIPFFIDIWNLKQDFGAVLFTHIPRERNKAADRLVNRALDEAGSTLEI